MTHTKDDISTRLGTINHPYLIAPDDWHENGLPYGAYCKCAKCGQIHRSTFTFDYHANIPGDPLQCETCVIGTAFRSVAPVMARLETEGAIHD
jgi:hypothetical protein